MTQPEHVDVVIVGGGIAGLTLALGLHAHMGVSAVVYEQAHARDAGGGGGTGGAIGLYANGLRVLRDIDAALLDDVVGEGLPYLHRRWLRHDAAEIAVGDEALLAPDEDASLQPIGIRRWRLLSVLVRHAQQRAITVVYGKRLESIAKGPLSNKAILVFSDASSVSASLVFGADGVKSNVRKFLFPDIKDPPYTGVTTLMCVAKIPPPNPDAPDGPPHPLTLIKRGIHFVSSRTSKFHACIYPLPDDEVNVQIYIPCDEQPETWGKLSVEDMRAESNAMLEKLRADGWHEKFVAPWVDPETVIRVGLRAREPLKHWAVGNVILLGDAAHPPVPYIGQGAMQAIEDAGVLSLLLKTLCPLTTTVDGKNSFLDLSNLDKVLHLYEQLRVERCTSVLASSHKLGEMNQRRAESWFYNIQYEWDIWWQVLLNGNLPVMLKGACYNYNDEVAAALSEST
ncbi:hypothetical protein HK100_005271 [Physocladia obscura]|uniref:FAD-binding domain-containing protein n=1 Tax=Physocladia obscura TaxID=109957 RepID=A0AAD5T8H7_9FUNG|nr:hypothetical protein HK100_005271 [Physocladia obscura]